MDKPLYLLVGKSASGKTTIADMLDERYGMKQVYSYTTRPPRYEGEIGHIFVTNEEFSYLGKLAAYTLYNGNKYGTTFKQLEECDVYVIDVPGIETLLERWEDNDRPIRIVYFNAAVSTRIMRMVGRGASDHEIISRLLVDDTVDDWYNQLDKLVWHYKNNEHMDVQLHKINANENIENVLEQILYYINNETE